MSINLSLSNAVSGLAAAQSGIAVTSDNIANVNTVGYARKQSVQETRTLGGVGAGVSVTEVLRIADEFLNREFRIAAAEAGRFDAMNTLQKQATALLGDPTGDQTLVASLDRIFNAAATLAANPETTSSRSAFLDALRRLGDDLDIAAEGVRDLRRQADLRIHDTVDEINSLIAEIDELNDKIVKHQGPEGTSALEDLRARKLDELGGLIDIRTFDGGNGRIAISTTAGVPLLDHAVRQIVHTPSDSADFGQVFPNLTLNMIDPGTGAVTQVGGALDARIGSGELRGLLDMRDGTLADLGEELGALTGHVADELNRVHNEFTAVPPPATLTGSNTGLLGTDPHGFTGIAHFHAFDANGNVTATATIDFGAIGGTVNDVIAAVNAGLGGQGTLSLTNGVMQFEAAGAAAGVAIQQDATSPSDNNGRGFSHRFGLNDLVRTVPGPHFDTGLSLGSAHGFTGQVTLELVGPQNQRTASATIDFGSIGSTMADVVNELNTQFSGFATFSLDAAGRLTATPASGFAEFDVEIASDTASRGGTAVSFSDFFGIGGRPTAEMTATFAVRSDLAENPALLSLASVNAAASPAVTGGDNSGALALQELGGADRRFDGAGRLPAMTGTLSEIGAELLGRAGQAAKEIEARAEDRQALRDEMSQRISEVSGVNLDEEMANLITYQTAFNASARVITATTEMFDALLAM